MSEGKGRRKIFTVLVAVVLIAVYFFVFSEPLRPELSAAPRWTIDLSASVASAEASAQDRVDASAVSFSTASRFGYFGTDGSIGFVGEATGPVPMSDSSYVSAELVPGGANYSLRSPVGARVAELDASAPFYSSGRLFSAQADGSGVAAKRIMPAEDIGQAILDVYRLGRRTVVEEIVLRPQLGDLP